MLKGDIYPKGVFFCSLVDYILGYKKFSLHFFNPVWGLLHPRAGKGLCWGGYQDMHPGAPDWTRKRRRFGLPNRTGGDRRHLQTDSRGNWPDGQRSGRGQSVAALPLPPAKPATAHFRVGPARQGSLTLPIIPVSPKNIYMIYTGVGPVERRSNRTIFLEVGFTGQLENSDRLTVRIIINYICKISPSNRSFRTILTYFGGQDNCYFQNCPTGSTSVYTFHFVLICWVRLIRQSPARILRESPTQIRKKNGFNSPGIFLLENSIFFWASTRQ